jgi:hypothetical protein
MLITCVAITTIMYVVHRFLLDEYAWVHRRCLKAWFVISTASSVQCVEAATHKRAMQDKTLSVPPHPPIFEPTAAKHAHYTITTPLTGEVLYLALCSIEAMTTICRKHHCTVNIWVVAQAATAVNDGSVEQDLNWFEQVIGALDEAGDSSYCIRIPSSISDQSDQLQGSNCALPLPCTDSRELRDWLSSPLARNQLPAHQSDAWRILALVELGGLYLDADVLPLSSQLLYLPETSIPSQNKVGAYHLNGGVLKMPEPVCHDVKQSNSPSFLDALMKDHLYWAPRLAQQPLDQQTFGFLGPCALTRVYTLHDFIGSATILSYQAIEPNINPLPCELESNEHLAIHFSGGRKHKWYSELQRSACLKEMTQSIGPKALKTRLDSSLY